MARFNDHLAELLAAEGVVVPEDFATSLTSAYDDDITEISGELNTTIGLRDERIRELMAQSAIETIPDADKEPFAEPGDGDDDLDDVNFDDFFTDDPDEEGRWDK